MFRFSTAICRLAAATTIAAVCGVIPAVARQAHAPKSAPAVKDLCALLDKTKQQSVAAKDPDDPGRFVAALRIPGVQMLVVSAKYERPTDLEYKLYHKDYMGVYVDLNSSVLAKDRVFLEDQGVNGLIAVPAKETAADSITMALTGLRTFNGDFADPKKRNQKKISEADYLKGFGEADEAYTRLLGVLIYELRKIGVF